MGTLNCQHFATPIVLGVSKSVYSRKELADINAEYAAGFLTEQHGKRGNWVDAVAAYHSTTPEYAETYIEKVEAVLMDLSANTASVEEFSPDPARAPAPNTFPLLQAGESGSLASLVPSGGALGPVFLVAP